MSTFKITAFTVLTLLGLLVGGTLAGKGGGKPPKGDPPADPVIAVVVNYDLFVIDADGSNETRLVRGGAGGPKSWSPDGTRIAFVGDSQGLGIYLINADGSGLQKIHALTTGPGRLEWSPGATADGEEKLAFGLAVTGGTDLFVINLDGSGLVNLTNSPGPRSKPSWSPGADRIVVLERNPRRVVVYDVGLVGGSLATTGSTDVTGALAGEPVNSPAWAKTKNEIAVYVDESGGASHGLWIIPVDAPADAYRVLAGETSNGSSAPSWSEDDSQILYGSWDPNAKKQGEMLKVLDFATGTTTRIYQPRNGNLKGGYWKR